MSSPAHRSLIGQSIGSYQIVERLGAGGMGVVYKARDAKLNRYVALKFLPAETAVDAESRRMLVMEARSASALDHPNIGIIHGIEESPDGDLFIVMAFYEGESLACRLRNGTLPVTEAIDIARQMARGLTEAHQRNIAHRDIKPSNTILTPNGVVKIVDFGLARVVESASATQSAGISGTACYMSPEQALGRRIDARTDIWSLGVVLYQMLTGRLPFAGDSPPRILFNIVNAAPAPLEGISGQLQRIVYRALAKDPAHRYGDASEMLADLEEAGSAVIEASTRSISPAEVRKYAEAASGSALHANGGSAFGRRRRMWIGGCIAVAAVAGILSSPLRQKFTSGISAGEKRVAVLPFTTTGHDPADTVLADGLMDSFTARLSNLQVGSRSLWVVPAGEVRRRNVTDTEKSRKEFGTNLVVTGTVQRDGKTVRLIVNLIDAETTRQLGSGEFMDRAGDFSLLQDSAVSRLANLMGIPVSSEMLQNTGGSVVPVAYEAYLKGLGYVQRYDKPGNLDRALESFQSAVSSDPKFALAYAGLGEAWFLKSLSGQNPRFLEQAQANCRRAAELNDQLAPVFVTLGRVHQNMGKQDLALEEFRRALELDPRSSGGLAGLARVYESQGRFADAEQTFQKASALAPDYWDGYNELGRFFLRRRRPTDAATQFRKVIELSPDNAAGYVNLGIALQNSGKLDEATASLRKATEIAPSYPALANLGLVLYSRKLYADAAASFNQALRMNDKDYRIWFNLALCNRWLGRDTEAVAAYRRALPLVEAAVASKDRDAKLQATLAIAYAHAGQREKAIVRLRTAATLAPGDPSILNMIGEGYEILGERRQALDWITKSLKAGHPADSLRQNPEMRDVLKDPRFQRSTPAVPTQPKGASK